MKIPANHQHYRDRDRLEFIPALGRALSRGNEVSVFLLGPAVEIEKTIGDERFDIQKLLLRFDELGGVILSCGTCLRIREMDAGAHFAHMSTMDDLVRLTESRTASSAFG